MGQHENGGVERRVLTPPALPLLVGPGPRCGPNLLRPMISAPMPGPQLLAKASSIPVLPPCSALHDVE